MTTMDEESKEQPPAALGINPSPPFRTMPLSRSWEDPPEGKTAIFIQPREERNKTTMQRTFHNSIQDAEDMLKSPDMQMNSSSRLGITPPTASTLESASPGDASPPRYAAYRSSLAGRVSTPFRYPDGSTNAKQQPLDPVILSFKEGDHDSDMSDDDDENANALDAPSSLQQRAYHYRLEDDVRSMGNRPVDSSGVTEPTSNLTRGPELPAVSEDDSDEENQASGPGQLYLSVLKTNKTYQTHVPTPPRKFCSGPHPDRILEQDVETESEQSVTFEAPVQLTAKGEVSLHSKDDDISETGGDLPLGYGKAAPVPRRRWKHCGRYLIGLGLVLLAVTLLVFFLVDRDWNPRHSDSSRSGGPPPLNVTNTPTAAPVVAGPTSIPTQGLTGGQPSSEAIGGVKTAAPTLATTSRPTREFNTPTHSPSWDPIRTDRLTDAVRLLFEWGRFVLWDDPKTPQYKAMLWWIGNDDWDSYSDERKIQRYALAVLFFSTDGLDSWRNKTGWLTDDHECFWFTSSVGSVCNQETQLLEILHLEQNQMYGTLPPEMALLTSLTEIRVIGNQIIDTIPEEWGQLVNLRVLELRGNRLAGGALSDNFAAWQQLETLDLSDNRYGGNLPGFVSELPQLIFLMLGGNGFRGPIPASWSSLSLLRVMSLESNRLTGGIPDSLGQELVGLRELRLGSNLLEDMGDDTWQFPMLEYLDMSDNRFNQTIPESLFSVETLTNLNLGNNFISGELSENIGSLSLLEEINLSNNRFGGELPDVFGDIRDLRVLELQSNQFAGELPGSLRHLQNIEVLRLDDNSFTRIDNVCRHIQDTIVEFYADCMPGTGLRCPCCTHCCENEEACFEVGAL